MEKKEKERKEKKSSIIVWTRSEFNHVAKILITNLFNFTVESEILMGERYYEFRVDEQYSEELNEIKLKIKENNEVF